MEDATPTIQLRALDKRPERGIKLQKQSYSTAPAFAYTFPSQHRSLPVDDIKHGGLLEKAPMLGITKQKHLRLRLRLQQPNILMNVRG